MTVTEFRRKVRAAYPHVRVSVRTVSFADLAREHVRCLRVSGDLTCGELRQINEWAGEAGILPDGNIRAR